MKMNELIVNVIFDAGKGSAPIASREGTVGEPFGTLPEATRPGYAFAGWELNGEPVTAETVLTSENDVRLTAKWERKSGEKKMTMLRRQKIAAFALAAVILALSVALAFANNLVQTYSLKDSYVDAEGNRQTEKYTIKKDRSTGLYALYNRKGDLMAVAPDNGFNHYTDTTGVTYTVYETDVSGNQYRINTSTGEYELYAVVDTDTGEELGGTVVSTRVMMFPRIKQAETYSIEVHNKEGSFRVYRKTVPNTGGTTVTTPYTTAVTIQVDGVDSPAGYDPTLYASLCVSCGYMLTMQKLDFTDPAAPRLADGSIDYSAYGLQIHYLEGGTEIDYSTSPAAYTITKAQFDAEGKCSASDTSYTVYVGDAIVSGGGYYVRMEGRDTVYIVSSDIANTVLQPVESLVTPSIIYPMSVSTYVMVYNFSYAKIEDIDVPEEDLQLDLISEFSFVDLSERENTIYSTTPYVVPTGSLMEGYQINNDAVSTVLGNLYSLEFLACKKLSPTKAERVAYGLTQNVRIMMFDYDPNVANGGSDTWVRNAIFISEKQYDEALGQDVYYVYSPMFDMVVAVDPYYFSFVEWGQSQWYNPYFFQHTISYLSELHLKLGDKNYDFRFDNSATDQSTTVSSTNLKVYCDQYTANADHLLDYTIKQIKPTDSGTERYDEISATDNFRRLYSKLLWYTIQGDVNKAEFKKETGKTVEEFIASDTGDTLCTAKITFRGEDLAKTLNTAVNPVTGEKIFTENNAFEYAIRFYEFGSGRNMLLTIETVKEHDAQGNPIYHADQAKGRFYVSATQMQSIRECAADLLEGKLLPSST